MPSGASVVRHAPCVYFGRCDPDGLIKIGTTRTLAERTAFWADQYEGFSVFAVTPGEFAREREIHTLFDRFRYETEWFHPSPLLYEFIAINAEPYDPPSVIPQFLGQSSARYVRVSARIRKEVQVAIGMMCIEDGVPLEHKINELLCQAVGRPDLIVRYRPRPRGNSPFQRP